MSLFRASSVLSILLTLLSCGPIKGYEGPNLPREQLGLVKLGSSKCDKCRVSEIKVGSESFFLREVLLLPGKYLLQSRVLTWGEPYNCRTESYFDDSTYSSCQGDRDEARRQDRRFYRDCSSEARRTRTVCSRNFSEFACSGGLELGPNQNWEVVAQTTSTEDSVAPGEASLVIKPFYSAKEENELTKLHNLEKPVLLDEQSVSSCRVINSGIW